MFSLYLGCADKVDNGNPIQPEREAVLVLLNRAAVTQNKAYLEGQGDLVRVINNKPYNPHS